MASRLQARAKAAVDTLFEGAVSPWIYAVLRVGLGAVFLVRHSDWLRPWVFLEHHRWVQGLEFLEKTPDPPFLSSPLVPGLVLGEIATRWLVYARTALAVLLVVGVRPRLAALLLAGVSYSVLFSDRYHYLHHLHLLYLSVAWLSLAPLGDRLSLERAIRRGYAKLRGDAIDHTALPATSPLWPLQFIRGLVLSIYAASGLAKLSGPWLRGDTLRDLHQLGIVGGPVWGLGEHWFSAAGVAALVCSIELTLPILLVLRRTRRGAVLLGWAFHALISATMGVSTFGVEMAILLLGFWHTEESSVRVGLASDATR